MKMTMPKPFLEKYNNLTEDKKRVVDDNSHNILISASAGTGKSYMLVTRLISRILKRELEIDEVVVMTFSRAAAVELQVKLMNELTACRDAAEDDETREYLNRQLSKLPSAMISTIHSFSLDIVKRYGYMIDFDPSDAGNVMDDSDKALFEKLAMEEVLKNPEDYKDLLDQLSVKPLDFSYLEEAIKNLAEKKYNYRDFEDWKKDVFEDFIEFENNRLPQRIIEEIKRQCKYLIEESKTYIPILRDVYNTEYEPPKKITEKTNLPGPYLDQFEQMFDYVLNNMDKLSIDEIITADYKPEKSFPSLSKNSDFDKKIFNALKEGLKNAHSQIEKYRKSKDALIMVAKRTIPYLKTLFELTDRYLAEIDKLKKNNNLIAFDDMSSLAIKILKADGGRVAEEYRNKYKEIMVDEYQDSSYEQEELVGLVSDNNVFRVGDVKQSIYSFRNAKPELMLSLIDEINPDKDILLHMKTNFRSVKNILDFSNYIFSYIFNVRDKDTYNPVTEDLEVDPKNDEVNDKIRLIKVKTDEGDRSEIKRRVLAEWVAQDIVRRVKSGECKYGEFKILVRKNIYKGWMFDIFNRLNVPAYASFNKGFFGDEAVSTVVSLLKLMINKYDQKAFVDVLRGPMYSYSEDEISEYFYNFNNKLEIKEDKDLRGIVWEFVDRLNKCKDIFEIMLNIYKEDDWYLNKISIRQRDNLDAFFEEVSGFSKDSSGIVNLLEYIDKQKDVDRSEATSASAQDDVVQIMSFHQSKGLDGRYVYLLDFSDQKLAEKDPILFDENLGISMHYIDTKYNARFKNPYRDMIVDKQDEEEFKEEMRLLYVAITRARRQLNIVYFNEKEVSNFCYGELYKLNYISIIKAVIKHFPDVKINSIIKCEDGELEELNMKNKSSADKKIEKYNKGKATIDTKAKPEIAHGENNKFIYSLDYNKPAGAERGSIMHRAIELLGIRQISESDIDNLDLVISKDDKKKILAFYNNPFTKELLKMENHHEYPYIAIIDGYPKNGTIDLLSIGEEIYVIDFKSDKNVTEKDLINRYTDQLNKYCDIVHRQYADKIVKAIIYSFDLGTYVDIPLED